MRKAIQQVPTREELVNLYDLHHFGLYFGRSIRHVCDMPNDIAQSWMPGPAFQKLGADYAAAFHTLCKHHLQFDTPLMRRVHGAGKSLEVRSDLLRRYEDGFIRAVVFPQVVQPSFIKVITNDPDRPPIDLLTGEVIENWQDTHHEYGGLHSHNTLGTRPSGTDDATEEKTPGVYAIFGAYRRAKDRDGWDFSIFGSVVLPDGHDKNKRRTRLAFDKDGKLYTRDISWDDIMEWDEESKSSFHPDVLKNIHLETPEGKKWEEPEEPQGLVLHPNGSPWWKQMGYDDDEHTPGTVYVHNTDGDDLKTQMKEFIYTELNRMFSFRDRKGVLSMAENSHCGQRLAWQIRSIVEDILELQADQDGEEIIEEILVPLIEDHTKWRLVSEERHTELEIMEEWHAENA